MKRFGGALALAVGLALVAPFGSAEAAAKRVQVTGEVIDTWCYFSGVMGGPDAVVGTAHHTCALWCAAGGIPVGLLTDEGEVYMIVKWQGDDNVARSDTLLDVQSNRLVADGMLHERDGVKYLLVEKVVSNEGIVNLSHEDFDVVPSFAIPKPKKQ